jgi:hypothetical protein
MVENAPEVIFRLDELYLLQDFNIPDFGTQGIY